MLDYLSLKASCIYSHMVLAALSHRYIASDYSLQDRFMIRWLCTYVYRLPSVVLFKVRDRSKDLDIPCGCSNTMRRVLLISNIGYVLICVITESTMGRE